MHLPLCNNGWVRIGSSGLRDKLSGRDVTINSPQDQAKFICNTNNLHQIVYVTIPGQLITFPNRSLLPLVTHTDYQPLQILYPTSDTANLRLSLNSAQLPACATLTSFNQTTNTSVYLYTADMAEELEPDPVDHTIAADVEQCGWITIYFFDVLVLEVFPGATFSCIVSSQWENMTRNFTFDSIQTTQPQSCPIPPVLPSTSIASSSSGIITGAITPTSSPIITSSNDNNGTSSTSTGIIAGTIIMVVLVIMIVLCTVCVLVIIVRRRHRRSPKKMYRLPDNNDSFAPDTNLGYPSLIETHTNQQFNGFSHSSIQQFSHNGVPVSRQMAKVCFGVSQTTSPYLYTYWYYILHIIVQVLLVLCCCTVYFRPTAESMALPL